MPGELHRNEVTDAQTVHENLRDAAHHEAGHVVVARFLGLTIRKIEIEEDGSGRADISSGDHLPLVDQIAVCVAGSKRKSYSIAPCMNMRHLAITRGCAGFCQV